MSLTKPKKFVMSGSFADLVQLSAAVQGRIARRFDEPLGADAEAIGIFLNTLSTLFPEGEQFFCESVRHYREKLRASDPTFAGSALDKDIGWFIGHEAHHTNAHIGLNEELYLRGYKNVDKLLKKSLTAVLKSPLLAIHATSVLEHYTATMARLILDHPDIRSLLGTAELDLWDYHAVDEWNHRSVSHSVLMLVDKHRGYMMVPVSAVFFAVVAALYIKNGGRWNTFLARKLIGLTPTILEYFNSDYTP